LPTKPIPYTIQMIPISIIQPANPAIDTRNPKRAPMLVPNKR